MAVHRSAPANVVTRSTTQFDLVVMLLAVWMVGGVFVDGWAHLNFASTKETFFTPWHGVLYSGFGAVVAWMSTPIIRARTTPLVERVPTGYGLGVAGLLIFGAGGVGDAVWHQLLGIETGIDALLSPTHLLLLSGGLLVLTSPVRAAWQREGWTPRLSELLPALLSITLTTALLAFFFAYAWGAYDISPATPVAPAALDELAADHAQAEGVIASGILSRLLTTVLLVGPLLVIMRRWRPPAGTATILFTTVSVLVFALADGVALSLLAAPVVAGIVTDLTSRGLGSRLDSRWWVYGLAGWAALVLWSSHFIALATSHGLAWPPELWGGAVLLAVLAAVGTAVVTFLPPVPGRAET